MNRGAAYQLIERDLELSKNFWVEARLYNLVYNLVDSTFTMVVKRKRETTVVSKPQAKEDSPPPVDNAQDVFRRLFEAQFEPLDLPGPTAKSTNSDEEENEDDDDSDLSGSEGDWDGMSDISDESNQVEVVEHTGTYAAPTDRMDKKTWKAFMVCAIFHISTYWTFILTLISAEWKTVVRLG